MDIYDFAMQMEKDEEAEEKKHLHIMENIVEFVSRAKPGKWLENAEWHHLEEL